MSKRNCIVFVHRIILVIIAMTHWTFKQDLSIFQRPNLKLTNLGRIFKTKSRFKSFEEKLGIFQTLVDQQHCSLRFKCIKTHRKINTP